MVGIGSALLKFWEWLFAQGAPVIVPISVIILGGIFRAPFRRTIMCALRMGVGFTALYALIGIIFQALSTPHLYWSYHYRCGVASAFRYYLFIALLYVSYCPSLFAQCRISCYRYRENTECRFF